MSKVTIEVPDNRWFRGEWAHRPEEDELILAVVRPIDGLHLPMEIYRYDGAAGLYGERLYVPWEKVLLWKPIGMSEEVERILYGPQEE